MTNRRDFLQIGITATAWPLASTAVRAAGAGFAGDAPLPLYKVIYDRRFSASRAFAERARDLGFAVHAINGDMTPLWYDELYHEWKKGPVAIAGLTPHGALFCFDHLGRDQGLRVVFSAEHVPADGHAVRHELKGPLGMVAESERLAHADGGWSRCMAEIVAQCPRGKSEIVSRPARTVSAAAWDAGREPLYTWVIAPAKQA